MRPAFLVVVLAPAALGCGDKAEPWDGARLNSAPVASLRVPVIAPAGRPVQLDASASTDANGDPMLFVFAINGTEIGESPLPTLFHVFPSPAVYSVLVRAIDMEGATGLAQQDVTVRDEYPDPPDFCARDADCQVADTGYQCEGGVCYASGGTIQ